MEPLTLEYIAKIIRYERPDAIVPGIGGQTGLNLAMQLEKKGVLEECSVELLGTCLRFHRAGRGPGAFQGRCASPSASPVIPSEIAYRSGGSQGRGPAHRLPGGAPARLHPGRHRRRLRLRRSPAGRDRPVNAFNLSPVHQVLIEKSIKGYKEIEFEVMRDSNDHRHHHLRHGEHRSRRCPHRRLSS